MNSQRQGQKRKVAWNVKEKGDVPIQETTGGAQTGRESEERMAVLERKRWGVVEIWDALPATRGAEGEKRGANSIIGVTTSLGTTVASARAFQEAARSFSRQRETRFSPPAKTQARSNFEFKSPPPARMLCCSITSACLPSLHTINRGGWP